MKPASLKEIKDDLRQLSQQELISVILRLAKYKKENKELLTYLLKMADDEELFIRHLKLELELQFKEINRSNNYYTKKGLRKVLRYLDRFLRYSGQNETEVELRLYYCQLMKEYGDPIYSYLMIANIYHRQKEKALKKIDLIHEDLRYDYLQIIESNDL